jgi:hypothetical protein
VPFTHQKAEKKPFAKGIVVSAHLRTLGRGCFTVKCHVKPLSLFHRQVPRETLPVMAAIKRPAPAPA